MKMKNVFYPVRLLVRNKIDKCLRRYFIFTIRCNINRESRIYQLEAITKNGKYLNKKESHEIITSRLENVNPNSIIITNIIELTESDYNDFTREVSND